MAIYRLQKSTPKCLAQMDTWKSVSFDFSLLNSNWCLDENKDMDRNPKVNTRKSKLMPLEPIEEKKIRLESVETIKEESEEPKKDVINRNGFVLNSYVRSWSALTIFPINDHSGIL